MTTRARERAAEGVSANAETGCAPSNPAGADCVTFSAAHALSSHTLMFLTLCLSNRLLEIGAHQTHLGVARDWHPLAGKSATTDLRAGHRRSPSLKARARERRKTAPHLRHSIHMPSAAAG
jgi:hypothetical protein